MKINKRMKELQELCLKAEARAKAILEKAQEEKRSPTEEEEGNYSAAFEDINGYKREIKMIAQKLEAEAAAAEAMDGDARHIAGDASDASGGGGSPKKRSIMYRTLRGEVDLAARFAGDARITPEYDAAFRGMLATLEGGSALNVRALSAGTDVAGGYLVPIDFAAGLIRAKDEQVFIRRVGNVIPLTAAKSLGAASLDADPADPTWTSELGTGDEDSTMAFGKRDLTPHPLAKRIKISKTLIRIGALDIEGEVKSRLAYKHAVTEENGFLNGTGSNQPLGVFTANAKGINTDRDVSTHNSTTEIATDNLIKIKYQLYKYWTDPSLAWCFHPDALEAISKLKDGEGRYLWRQALTAEEPDRLLNIPFHMSAYAPNTFTTGLYVGILGAWKYYWIVDALGFTVQVLVEKYAETNQNAYISRTETDGMPVLSEAFRRVTLG